ncbi:helix-turn-helix domain-containing protein [Halobaculum sp. D14]|uniref:helix-turn-helix domain-containing protein n=1 Tax=Halobaculum sp. D14 TaxID=3421642 RepID=UPI003EB9F614
MKRTTFSVRYPDRLRHPFHRRLVSKSSVSRADLLMWSPTPDATTLFWCDGDPAATRSVVDAVDSLQTRSTVETADGTYVFLRQSAYEFPDTVLAAVEDARVVFVPPVTFLESGAVRFDAVGDAAALGALADALSDLGDLRIERVAAFDRQRAPAELTARQRAALDEAVSAGYYDVPRTGSVADVADALDCSTSTAGELVRKAEAAVVRQFAARGRGDHGGS